MKCIVFDTGPLITFSLNNLLWVLKPLKEKYLGEFYIPLSVKKECVDKPLESKKFKFEALQILKLLQDGIIKVYDDERVRQKANSLFEKSNSLFKAHDNFIKISHYAEIETLALGKILEADAVVIDEFITRNLIENPMLVHDRLEKKLHLLVNEDNQKIKELKQELNIKILRSFELILIAYEIGLFKDYSLNMPNAKKILLEGLLWGIKLNGCSVSEDEINEAIRIEKA